MKQDREGLITRYVETPDELAELPGLTADAIIYQGEAGWTPVRMAADERYKNYLDERFRAGIRAQRLFRTLANGHGLIVEAIAQDRSSFRQYTDVVDCRVKRGDFLIRNVRSLEVEVKCLSLHHGLKGQYYCLRYGQMKDHVGMERCTGSSVVLAVFRRSGENPVPESLMMLPVSTIFAENNKSVTYDKSNKSFRVPLTLFQTGFRLIDAIRLES